MRLVLATVLMSAGLALGAASPAAACQPDGYCPPPPPWCGTRLEKYLGCVHPY